MKSLLTLIFLVSAHANAALSAFPTLVSFYNVPVNGGSQSQTVTIQNNGSETLNPSVSNGCFGDLAADNYCYSISPNGSCFIQIRFSPTRSGFQSCSIFVSAGAQGTVSVSVNGQGVD